MTTLSAGDKAPDFNLNSSDGSNISLDQLKGKKIVIYFFQNLKAELSLLLILQEEKNLKIVLKKIKYH